MKQYIFIIILLIFSQSCVILRNSRPDRVKDWDKYYFEKVRNYDDIVSYIKNQKNYKIIGTVNTKLENYDVYEISINNGSKNTVLIFGGIHGDELSGITSSINFIENYKLNKISKDFNYIIIPVVNPWGYEYNIRFNSLGVDINTDFAPGKFDTQEAEIIFNAYDNLNPYIVIDNHEDNWQSKNYFFIYNKKSEEHMRKFINSHSNYNYDNESKLSIFKTKNGINHISKSILWFVKASDRYALSNYFLEKTDNVVVIETGTKDVDLKKRDIFHLDSMNYIINNL